MGSEEWAASVPRSERQRMVTPSWTAVAASSLISRRRFWKALGPPETGKRTERVRERR